ncbi:apolipoprotein N-acyltransferase [Frondihabitans sp. PhB161]|nr:apolipoprotein N-acyltransferase [Frondihabitans sp. PhB153]RPF04216.1 apolipoprotein N-acyltransferase [Frondihabitans sp. PhB161]
MSAPYNSRVPRFSGVPSPSGDPRTSDFRLPLWIALVTGVGGGALMEFGFPDRGIWPLTFVGIGLILLALKGRSVGGSLLVGLASGMTFFFVLIDWVATYLGPVPWIALAGLEALIFALGAIPITLAYRWVPRVWQGTLGRTLLLPVVVAGLWVGREFVAGHYPYGGFSWGRVAESQSQSPFASLTAWLGISGLSFVMVALVAAVMQLLVEQPVRLTTRALVAATAIVAVLAVPAWPSASAGSSTIAAVQGNSKAGFFQQRTYGDLSNAQVDATYKGVLPSDDIDMLVWPEGASDRDPTRDRFGAYIFDVLSKAYGAPIVSGVITERGSKDYNSSIVWDDGTVQAQYDKRHLVPFGEYVPDRPFFNALAPSLVGLLTRDLTPGTNTNVLDVGSIKAGISICFDIVDDALTREMVDGGAQVILAQTNNADFGQTDENTQQLAIARLRAIETSRPLVNISTVGSSAVISADGKTIDSIPAFQPGAMVTKVPLGTGTTPAVWGGAALEQLAMFFAAAALVLSRVLLRGSGYGDAARQAKQSDRLARRSRRLGRAAQ